MTATVLQRPPRRLALPVRAPVATPPLRASGAGILEIAAALDVLRRNGVIDGLHAEHLFRYFLAHRYKPDA